MRLAFALLPVLVLAGCASRQPAPEFAAIPPPQAAPMPRPPAGAAANLVIPALLADGSYATPNRDLSAAGSVWHLRAALNVAALQCGAGAAASYNQLLAAQKRPLADAHRQLADEYRARGGQAAFDGAMTRLYNFFALPPAQSGFCAEAGQVLAEAAVLPASGLDGFAATALPRLERPFTDFYRAYDSYKLALAAWRPNQLAAAEPRLAYDPAIFAGSDIVTASGGTRLASR
jgi:hypothetical protein